MKDSAPTGPDWVALIGTALTIALHLVLAATTQGPSVAFIAGACLFWSGFVVIRVRQDRGVLRTWGFRGDNLLAATGTAAIVFVVAVAGLAIYAHLHGTLRFPLPTLLLFLVYPLWGVIQQFLALGIVVTNLERIPALSERKVLLVLLGAGLFGLVHIYDVRLVAGTTLLELVVIPLFLRQRNVWPLGVLHGWLGGLFYLWILNRDLWAEAFG
ncbi:MAG TPA: CPBP family glutamic-type intramembrane protease [Gemmataceae bacterium]|nr:CPBP family glutamic-type intramembrane protease [Gemmataceae bacterium]